VVKRIWPVFLVILMLIGAALACSFSFSSASIENIQLARDQEGEDRATTFNPLDTVYVVFDLEHAPPETTVQAIWTLVEANGEEVNEVLLESEEIETSSAEVWFSLSNSEGLPIGNYKVDIFLNEEREETLTFEVAPE
jgi:hypothetical protein